LVQRVLRGKFSHGQTTFSPPFHYRATVTSVYDGDTCTVDLDLGLSITLHKQKIRLNRINAPELRGRSQRGAVLPVISCVVSSKEKEVLLQTIKDRKGKYGRYLGEIWVKQGRRMVNVNDLLVTEGHAKHVEY
jgi:micrococcal nuclease